jgi:hypothetical protein
MNAMIGLRAHGRMRFEMEIALLAKRNRVEKSDRQVITPKDKESLRTQLKERMQIRRDRENGRRINYFK